MIVAVAALAAAASSPHIVSEAALRAYAESGLEKGRINERRDLGVYRGTRMIAEYRCSDVCPNATVRIIRFDVEPGAACRAIGGQDMIVTVPSAIAGMPRKFCVPAILSTRAVRRR